MKKGEKSIKNPREENQKKKNPRERFWTSELPVPRSAVAVSAAAGSTVLSLAGELPLAGEFSLAGERSLAGDSSLGGVVEADGTSGPASGRS